ncbi:class I SAM-dependent methyltransferase [Thermodesulfobacteriota bacterium]
MDLMKLGFGDNSFDVVTAVECLQHVDIHITIPEFMRVTRQNGMIAISVPNRKDPIIKKAEIRNNGLFQGVDWLNLREFLNRDERVKCIRIKPLIFARDQSEKPYLDAEFKQRLSEEEIEQANRFIIHIEL